MLRGYKKPKGWDLRLETLKHLDFYLPKLTLRGKARQKEKVKPKLKPKD